MLNKLIQFSLSHRPLILALALVVFILGVKTARELPVEVLPDLTKPTVTILTEAAGFSPEEVETLVTIPLENSLMGVTGVTRLRAVNDIGLSLVFIEFEWGTDIYQASQFVQERLTGVSEALPEEVSPYMTPVASLMGNILFVGLVDPTGVTSHEICEPLRTGRSRDDCSRFQGSPKCSRWAVASSRFKFNPIPTRCSHWEFHMRDLHGSAKPSKIPRAASLRSPPKR